MRKKTAGFLGFLCLVATLYTGLGLEDYFLGTVFGLLTLWLWIYHDYLALPTKEDSLEEATRCVNKRR